MINRDQHGFTYPDSLTLPYPWEDSSEYNDRI